jgi:glycosyltransferase involved in cell wall biosynthesis
LKAPGFERLLREGWWRQMLFVDEFLAAELQSIHPSSPVFFLPDPCPPGYDGDPIAAKNMLEIPRNRKVFLFYGTGARRKGLHLAVEAMRQLPPESPVFLLCAGQQNPSGKTAAVLAQLVRQNRACLLDHYVTVKEEKMCFEASDAVLLPYLNHFGTSGVLSRAMSAGKPVIVSDEQLLGRLTRERRLGLVFPSGNSPALRDCISQIAQLSATDAAPFAAAARDYAKIYSREAFRTALVKSFAPGSRT